MIDVFIRTTSGKSRLRQAMGSVTFERWGLEPVNLYTLVDVAVREGRLEAERRASSDPYIYTDDDVLIVGKNWVERGTKAMLANPVYAVASTLSLVEGENILKPPVDSGAIYDCFSVGAPMWIRKGILTELPEMDMNGECGAIYEIVLRKGYKEGLIAGIRHNHLGHGFSSNPSLCYGV